MSGTDHPDDFAEYTNASLDDAAVRLDAKREEATQQGKALRAGGGNGGGGESDADADASRERPLPISDFIAYSPDHTYIHRATGAEWTSTAVNARVMPVKTGVDKKPLAANVWLDRNDAVEQRTWAPGEPRIIKNKLVADGGFFPEQNARVFNLYKPPFVIGAKSREIKPWRDRLYALWPEQANHIECWLAHRAQRPGDKINHALVLGGKPGIGKDALLAPLKTAVGPWNFTEISPQAVLGTFNEFARSVVLRISEAKDLGDIDRFAFYEATKTLMAAPPDSLRINPKYMKPYYAMNVTGIIVTTNHKVGGLFLPPDDRRHFVLGLADQHAAGPVALNRPGQVPASNTVEDVARVSPQRQLVRGE
jgi:hypothetical protein